MEIFSIVCLVLIMCGLQHLLNWFWRKNYNDEGALAIGVVISIVVGVVSLGIVRLIILWGKNLI